MPRVAPRRAVRHPPAPGRRPQRRGGPPRSVRGARPTPAGGDGAGGWGHGRGGPRPRASSISMMWPPGPPVEHRFVTHRKPAAAPRATGIAVYAVRRIAAWVLGLLLLSGTAAALAVAVYPMVTSGSALTVLSGSMTPGLPVGGMVFTRPVDPADVVAGGGVTLPRPPNPAQLGRHCVVSVVRSGGAAGVPAQGGP